MNRLIEFFRLSKREYYADFFITPPITLALAVISVYVSWSLLWPVWFILGIVSWTFYEYCVHRFVSHKVPLFKQAHWLHHAQPTDFIAVPPWATVTVYVGFWLLFGVQSSAFMVGFSVGYIAYSVLHTMFHFVHVPSHRSQWLWKMRHRHALHHAYDEYNYGVTVDWWDRLGCTEWSRQ